VAFAEAELALSRGDYRQALEALPSVELLDPDFPYAAARLGEIALAQGDAASAERYFSEAVEQRSGPWRDLLGRGIARLRQGKIEPALQDANTLLASSPDQADVHLFAYQVYALKGDAARARTALDQGIAQLEADSQGPAAAQMLERAIAIRERDPASVDPLDIGLGPQMDEAATQTIAGTTDVSQPAQSLESEVAQTAQQPVGQAPAAANLPATDGAPQDAAAAMGERMPGTTAGGAPRAAELAAAEAELAELQRVAESLEAERRALRSNLQGADEQDPSPREDLNATVDGTPVEPEVPRPSPEQAPSSAGDTGIAVAPEAPAAVEGSDAEPAATTAGIEAFVRSWAAAWSRQDVDDYLSHYATDFLPANGGSRSAWAAERRDRLTRPTSISVEISDLEVDISDDGRAQVSFKQAYRASHYRDEVGKTLDLTREDGAWKILRESTQG